MNPKDNNIEAIHEKDLVVKNEVAYRNEKPFNGLAFQDCKIGPDGPRFTYYMPYKNGIKEGVCKAYYNNNQLKYEVEYIDGNRCGDFIDRYENGQLQQVGNYENGKKVGIWKSWFKDGCKESIIIFENNSQIESKWWFNEFQLQSESNKLGIFEDDKTKIISRRWYKNSQLEFEKKIIKKNNQIILKEWKENGQLITKRKINSDGREKLFERTFYDNGVIESERNYKIDYTTKRYMGDDEFKKVPIKINHGVHKQWFVDGKISYYKEYKDGKGNGIHKSWQANGRLEKEFFCVEGKYDGVVKEWFSGKGDLCSMTFYKKGYFLYKVVMFPSCDYVQVTFYISENGANKKITEYRKLNGELLPKSEWPKEWTIDEKPQYDDYNRFNNTYYDDQLDMDQQSPEFWDSL